MRGIIFLIFFAFATGERPESGDRGLYNDDLFQGDIIGIKPNQDRNSVVDTVRLWPGGVVYFQLEESVVNETKAIMEAIEEFHKKTCLKFVERFPATAFRIPDYILVSSRGMGCASELGRKKQRQWLNLEDGCYHKGIIIHEFMHAIGFHHEQSRSDRDNFVEIQWDNIPKEKQHNFGKVEVYDNNLLNEVFDFDSVMMYEWNAFALDSSRPTIVPKDRPDYSWTPVNGKTELSQSDVRRINKLYQCFGEVRPAPPDDVPDNLCTFDYDDCEMGIGTDELWFGNHFVRKFMTIGNRTGYVFVLRTEWGTEVQAAQVVTPYYRVYGRSFCCLSFDYYMSGEGRKDMAITKIDDETTRKISTIKQSAMEWINHKVVINTEDQYRNLFILTVMGLDNTKEGIVALDNIKFSSFSQHCAN